MQPVRQHPRLKVGEVFAQSFQVVRPILAGVYVVQRLPMGEHLALKVVERSYSAWAHFREFFETLPEVTARVKNDHVVKVVGAGFDAATRTSWAAMELLRGEDLEDYVGRVGPLPR